jgi:hypothetical protein
LQKWNNRKLITYWRFFSIKNELQFKKLQPTKIDGSKAKKYKPSNITKPKPDPPKNFLYVVLLLLEFKDDL